MRFHIRYGLMAIALLVLIFTSLSPAHAQLKLHKVFPFLGSNQMLLEWKKFPAAQAYEFRRKVDGGAYSAWINNNLDTFRSDNSLSATSSYTYQVRVKVGGNWVDTSNERSNNFKRLWPVRKASDCTTESVEILHGFGQPINSNGDYFHEGVDINGETSVHSECVRAPIGGTILYHGGSGANIAVNLEVYVNGALHYIQFNHLANLNVNLVDGETVAAGDSLGFITSVVASWSVLSSHTHNHFWGTYAQLFATSKNPFLIYDNDAYRDPQGNSPELLDVNGDGQTFKFKEVSPAGDYFADDGKLHNGVDIIVEAVDKMSTDAPWQVPKVVGYYIQKMDNGSWVNAVKSGSSPYILYDNINYYETNTVDHNLPVVHTIIDYKASFKGVPPETPATYSFQQWFTFIVTNTSGTDGSKATLDSAQQWATDARVNVISDNGYVDNYDKARAIDEAKFKDGKFKIRVRLRDFVNSPADAEKEVTVDNFRPYAKKVEINSGRLNYLAYWTWDPATGQLNFTDNTDNNKACGRVVIKVTFSEAMKQASIDVPSLYFSKLSATPIDADRKVFEFEIPASKTKDADEGPHKILINGKDMAENDLQGFLSKTAVPAAGMEKKVIDGSFTPGNPPTKDKVHEFKLVSLKDKITVNPTDVTSCNKANGKASIHVSATGKFEYAVDSRPWQNFNMFEDLAKGSHIAKVRDSGQECEVTKDFEIKENNKLEVNIAGAGTTEFCSNANPPTITLTASASGGSGFYSYTWPSATKSVNSSGFYFVTVTDDTTGCKKSKGADVIFIPILCSRDPNDIIGPEGYGPGKQISKFKRHNYMIRFENDPAFATAPAQVVKINHPLDTNVNIFSLRLGEFGFGGMTFPVPANRTFYSTRLNVMDSLGVVVDVTAGIDVTNRQAFWIFESKDPVTGLPPTNGNLGFLPINDSTSKGEGFVTYNIKPADHTQSGDSVFAIGSIVFDLNPPLETPRIFNTIDAASPVSQMKPLPLFSGSTQVQLAWSGQDELKGSGVRDYDLFVSKNGGVFELNQSAITDTVTSFTGEAGATYRFYTIATDNTGNREADKSTADKTTTLVGIYEIRTVAKCFGEISVEMRSTAGSPPDTSNRVTAFRFGIKWPASYNVELSIPVTNTYKIIKAGSRGTKDTYHYQVFQALTTGYKIPAAWTTGGWVEIMRVSNTRTGSGTGTFTVAEQNFHPPTDPVLGINSVNFIPFVNGVATNVLINPTPVALGPDKTTAINCDLGSADLTSLYNTSGYLSVSFNTVTPTQAAPGLYQLIVASGDGCKDTANITVVDSSRVILGAIPNISKIANRECTDAQGWTHYYNNNGTPSDYIDDIRLLSIRKNGNNIGTVGDGTFILTLAATAGAGSNHAVDVQSPLVPSGSKFYSMNRYWNLIPTQQPISPVGVRFYYNTQDLNDVSGDYPSGPVNHGALVIYKLTGGNPNPTSNWAGGTGVTYYNNSVSSSLITWQYTSLASNRHQAEFMVNNFSGGGAGARLLAAVPVVLSSFDVQLEKDKVKISWSTSTEINSKHFLVQRSLDGINFDTIAIVQAAGNSFILRNYQHDDVDAMQYRGQRIYYRISQVDISGRGVNTGIKSIRIPERSNELVLLYNPVQQEAILKFDNDIVNDAVIRIIDMAGRILFIKETRVVPGNNQIKLNTAGLADGIYEVDLTSGGQRYLVKMVKN